MRSNFLIHITSKNFAHDSISMAMLRLSYAQVRSFGGHVSQFRLQVRPFCGLAPAWLVHITSCQG